MDWFISIWRTDVFQKSVIKKEKRRDCRAIEIERPQLAGENIQLIKVKEKCGFKLRISAITLRGN